MAKITARGDREAHRWRRDEDGAGLVLTVKGRLLHKFQRGASFTLRAPRSTLATAEALASEWQMARV